MKNFLVAGAIAGLACGCSRESPTTASTPGSTHQPAPTLVDVGDAAVIERQTAQLRALYDEMSLRGRASVRARADEDFNCENVEEVRVRFSDPGYVNGLRVGLFVKFVGMPAGAKKLRIWWDHENAFHEYQDVAIGEGDVNSVDRNRFDVAMVIDHAYETSGRKRVRVELILRGADGNCARNRLIVVAPNAAPSGVVVDHVVTFGGVPNCINGFGSRSMGLWANFNPPIPAGTPYTVEFRVSGTGVVGPSITIAMVGNTAGPDSVTPPTQSTPPPNDFTVTLNPTVQHAQLQIATQIFSFAFVTPTSLTTKVLAIDVPGKKILIVDNLEGSCP